MNSQANQHPIRSEPLPATTSIRSFGRLIELAVFLVLAVAAAWPSLARVMDFGLQRLFFSPDAKPGWFLQHRPPWRQLYLFGTWPALLVALAAMACLGIGFCHAHCRRWRPHALYLVLVMAIGPGLLVNALFKDHWGRPRPCQIEEYGGVWQYQTPIEKGPSGRGKSFPCGHSSMGYYFFAGWFLLRERRPKLAWFFFLFALAYGGMIGLARMAAGAHFASDVVWSGLMVWFVCWFLYHFALRMPVLERGSAARGNATTHSPWPAVITAAFSIAMLAAGLIATPQYRELRFDAPTEQYAGPPSIEFIASDLNIELELHDELQFMAQGFVQGFGWPWSKIQWNVERDTTAGSTPVVRLRLGRHGRFTELYGEVKLLLPADRLAKVLIALERGDVRCSGLSAAMPPMEIRLRDGVLRGSPDRLQAFRKEEPGSADQWTIYRHP